jgi:hypothetical protein
MQLDLKIETAFSQLLPPSRTDSASSPTSSQETGSQSPVQTPQIKSTSSLRIYCLLKSTFLDNSTEKTNQKPPTATFRQDAVSGMVTPPSDEEMDFCASDDIDDLSYMSLDDDIPPFVCNCSRCREGDNTGYLIRRHKQDTRGYLCEARGRFLRWLELINELNSARSG